MNSDGTRDSGQRGSRRQLYVEFELERLSTGSCPLGEFSSDFEGARQRIVDGECHTDTRVSVDDGDESSEQCETQIEVVHTVSDVTETCFCPVFEEFGCIPKVTEVTDDCVRVETYLSDRERLSALVDALKSVTEAVRLRRLKRVESRSEDGEPDTVVFCFGEMTETQRETAIKAVAIGYYSSPREASLGELAEDLNISKSACSQRLNAVESKLATAAFSGATDSG